MKRTFLKHALWTALFVAGGALAQDAAISGADFTHGKADAQLAAIGNKAAAQGKVVVVTAPSYWQAKVAARIRAGGHGKPVAIRFSNGFYENVLVRTEAAAPVEAAAKPETRVAVQPEAKAKAQPKPAPKVVKAEPKPTIQPAPKLAVAPPVQAKPQAVAPAMQPVVQRPVASIQTPAAAAPRPATDIVVMPQVSHQPAVVPIPTAAINAAGVQPMSSGSPGSTGVSVRQRMLATLNNGRPAMGSLTEAQLQPGDQVYSDGGTLAMVRMEGLHRDLYWLQGSVDLQRVQFMPQGDGRYAVTGTIDPKAPAAHRANLAGAHHVIVARVPASGATGRTRLEQQYNNGQPISASLNLGQLQPEDRLVVEGENILVARREGNSMVRYWLEGSIDLGQSGLQKVDANIYRVTGNSLH